MESHAWKTPTLPGQVVILNPESGTYGRFEEEHRGEKGIVIKTKYEYDAGDRLQIIARKQVVNVEIQMQSGWTYTCKTNEILPIANQYVDLLVTNGSSIPYTTDFNIEEFEKQVIAHGSSVRRYDTKYRKGTLSRMISQMDVFGLSSEASTEIYVMYTSEEVVIPVEEFFAKANGTHAEESSTATLVSESAVLDSIERVRQRVVDSVSSGINRAYQDGVRTSATPTIDVNRFFQEAHDATESVLIRPDGYVELQEEPPQPSSRIIRRPVVPQPEQDPSFRHNNETFDAWLTRITNDQVVVTDAHMRHAQSF